jgi:isoleucyl-tRNA synthetase
VRQAVLTTAGEPAAAVDTYGADAWYERPLEEFVPEGFTCPSCHATTFEREQNILDVWFDSGSSHEGVLPVHTGLSWPADMYLEGTDQYRGWFHSSLLVGLGTRHQAPFNQVLTHGFVHGETDARCPSRSATACRQQDVVKQGGAEILRLWASMVDYREDIRIGKEILTHDRGLPEDPETRCACSSRISTTSTRPATAWPTALEEFDRWVLASDADVATKTSRPTTPTTTPPSSSSPISSSRWT